MSGRRSPCPSRTPTCVNAQQGVKLGQQAQRSAAQAQRSEAGKLSQLARGEHTLEWLGRELCLCHRCWVLINRTRGKPQCPHVFSEQTVVAHPPCGCGTGCRSR